jgi:hypothetical protein
MPEWFGVREKKLLTAKDAKEQPQVREADRKEVRKAERAVNLLTRKNIKVE